MRRRTGSHRRRTTLSRSQDLIAYGVLLIVAASCGALRGPLLADNRTGRTPQCCLLVSVDALIVGDRSCDSRRWIGAATRRAPLVGRHGRRGDVGVGRHGNRRGPTRTASARHRPQRAGLERAPVAQPQSSLAVSQCGGRPHPDTEWARRGGSDPRIFDTTGPGPLAVRPRRCSRQSAMVAPAITALVVAEVAGCVGAFSLFVPASFRRRVVLGLVTTVAAAALGAILVALSR